MRLRYGGACSHTGPLDGPALEVVGLSHHYPGADKPALSDLGLRIARGERVALVGPNGAGKSTLLKLLAGLLPISTGQIRVYGRAVKDCRHRVSIVPQRSAVDWSFPVSVREVVMMGRLVHLGWFISPKKLDHDLVDAALETMQIADLAHKQVGELSGGQQQRVMLARSLAHDADLLLLDEPLNHVDIATQELIFHTLETLCKKGKTALVSTHDLGLLPMHFSRAIFVDGSIIADGPVAQVLAPETIAKAYGFEFHEGYPV